MILTVDIGNTNISFGVFEGEEIRLMSRLATQRQRTPDQYAVDFMSILKLHSIDLNSIEGASVSSVVPELTNTLVDALSTFCNKVVLLAPGTKTGLNILIENPAYLGADLAAGAVGTIAHYPLPAFVIDLGTATKIYAVDEHNSFVGGLIAPGVEISLNALTSTSSQLPTIALEAPSRACSKNTVECMQSGSVFGTACLIDGMLDRFIDELGEPETIVATGGLSSFIINECKHEITYDANLIMKGLKVIYDKNA